MDDAKRTGIKHLLWCTVEDRKGECGTISWSRSKAFKLIEDLVIASGIPYTLVYIPMYYENFWTKPPAPSYDEGEGLKIVRQFSPQRLDFAFSPANITVLVVPAVCEPENYAGVKIKTVVQFLLLRGLATQFYVVTDEKANLALELTPKQFAAPRRPPHGRGTHIPLEVHDLCGAQTAESDLRSHEEDNTAGIALENIESGSDHIPPCRAYEYQLNWAQNTSIISSIHC
ncbi:hypothetical protein C8Q78DRAFT_994237 [Trametes maxima]|nr:hypothetical protein C8Q78DRAFT_994237 [Trametes maxima]